MNQVNWTNPSDVAGNNKGIKHQNIHLTICHVSNNPLLRDVWVKAGKLKKPRRGKPYGS